MTTTTHKRKSYNGLKEFQGEWNKRKPYKRYATQRITPVRLHVVVSYLRSFHERGVWRLFETSPDDWTLEGSESICNCVFALIQGWKGREVAAADAGFPMKGGA